MTRQKPITIRIPSAARLAGNASGNPTNGKEKVMKAKRLIILAAVLFALGCGDEWNPVGPPRPEVPGPNSPECNMPFQFEWQRPPYCIPPSGH